MPFSLFYIPACFYNYINKIFTKKLDRLFTIYLNDIIIDTKNPSRPYVKVLR